MGGSLGALLPIIGCGPGTMWDRRGGPLYTGLAQERRARQAPVPSACVAAALGDGGNTDGPLDLCGAALARSRLAESGQQAWGEGWSGTG